MSQDLSREQFELIRKVVKEKKEQEAAQGGEIRPRKRRKRHGDNPMLKIPEPAPVEVVVLDSSDSDDIGMNTTMDAEDEEEFNSDEFEDVLPEDESDEQGENDELNITFNKVDKKAELEAKKMKQQQQRNVVSNEAKQFRKDFHAEYLLCLMIHGHLRNEWLNDDKLLNKLFKKHIIPEKVEKLLHPTLDKDLPLRSSRKLLDGLKQAMQLWIKHCHIIKSYVGVGLYMRQWDEISKHFHNKPITKSQFIKDIVKGRGNRDILAQGFVALLRTYDVNARLIFSCQPPDYCNMKLNDNSSAIDNGSFKYPIFWCEVWDKFAKRWITIDPINLETIEQIRHVSKLEPDSRSLRNVMRYVIAYDRKLGCKDVTRRYVKQMYSYKFRHSRITNDPQGQEWYDKVVKSLTLRKRMKIDDYEDVYFSERDDTEGMPGCLQDFKKHPVYILEKDIKQTQLLKADAKECGFFKLNNKKQNNKVVKVFYRKDIMELKSPRQWYQLGRILIPGARFRKIIKKRGFGVMNKFDKNNKDDDDEDNEERLYSVDETELYIPQDANVLGEIKKNTYGNIEIFTQSMIPHNCVLIESSIAVKACKFIRIEYAPAVTSFNFQGKKRMGKGNVKPVISGVVVAQWYKNAVVAAIEGIQYSLEQDKKHEDELNSLQDWNDMLLRLRIKSNLNETYGLAKDEPKTSTSMKHFHDEEEASLQEEEEDFPMEAGGFFMGNREYNDSDDYQSPLPSRAGGFLPPSKSEAETGKETGTETETNQESEEEQKDQKDNEILDTNDADTDDEYEAFMDDLTEEDEDN